MHAQPFTVTICDQTIHVHGDVDMAATQQLLEAITHVAGNQEHRSVVVDMASLTFLDSAGIAALIDAHKAIEAMGKEMTIDNVPERTHRTLTLAGVVGYLNVQVVSR